MTSVPELYRYVPGVPAVKLYVTVPLVAAAEFVSDVRAPAPSNSGATGCPPTATSSCPGQVIEVASGSVLRSVTVTLVPDFTQSVGPGSWNERPVAV